MPALGEARTDPRAGSQSPLAAYGESGVSVPNRGQMETPGATLCRFAPVLPRSNRPCDAASGSNPQTGWPVRSLRPDTGSVPVRLRFSL